MFYVYFCKVLLFEYLRLVKDSFLPNFVENNQAQMFDPQMLSKFQDITFYCFICFISNCKSQIREIIRLLLCLHCRKCFKTDYIAAYKYLLSLS